MFKAIIIVIIIALIFWYTQLRVSVDKFGNQLPKERFPDLMDEFGTPDMLFNMEGGFAVWKKRGIFEKIMLKDESIAHYTPKPHCDFLYSTIRVHIPDNALGKVLELSRSLYYDDLKQELTSRCHFMGATVATLYLAMHIIEDHSDHKRYKDMYNETITSSMKPDVYKQLLGGLKTKIDGNQMQYAEKLVKVSCPINL